GQVAGKDAPGGAGGYGLGVTDGHVYAEVGGAGGVAVRTQAAVAQGLWHHAALTVDRAAGVLTLYVDGEAQPLAVAPGSCGTPAGAGVDISACTGITASSDAPFTVGAQAGTAAFFAGQIDEVRAFPYALAASQVAQLVQ